MEFDPFDDLENPRLNDALGIDLSQEEVEFAIPRLTRDIPLAIDPFLMWNSGNTLYEDLHDAMLGYFDVLRDLVTSGRDVEAFRSFSSCGGESEELGLGFTRNGKRGRGLSPALRKEILRLFRVVPQLADGGLTHIETVGLVVPNIAEDRLSDISASVFREFLIDFSTQQAELHDFPLKKFRLDKVLDLEKYRWRPKNAMLPYHPVTNRPILLAPLDLLRHLPWINYDDYASSPFANTVLPANPTMKLTKPEIQARNRDRFSAVEAYVADKEDDAERCTPDPLFKPLKESTLRTKLSRLRSLKTGRKEGADKEFEAIAFSVLATLLHPHFELAKSQERTNEGVHIRDMIFYNSARAEFARDIKRVHGSIQVVAEFKNVQDLTGDHINQLYRYLGERAGFGRFGLLVCRNPIGSNMRRNLRDLYLSKEAVVLPICDDDFAEMLEWHLNGHHALGVLQRKYAAFMRSLPS